MEKQIEKKQVKNETVVNVDSVNFIKLSEMTSKDILNLDRFNGSLVKTKTKKGQLFYKVVIELDHLLKIERTLSEIEYNLIVLERKLRFDLPIQHILIPTRLIKGVSVNNFDWYRYEFFISRNFIQRDWFKPHEVALMKVANINLNFVMSDEKVEDDLISSFNEEDFI